MDKATCPECGSSVTVERDPDDRGYYLALHGGWPVCQGSGRQVWPTR